MKIAVLGTGAVGETIGTKLIALGHEVKMGSRSATHEKGLAWVKRAGERASLGTFADAAAFGELAFNCTAGFGSIPALKEAAAGLKGKLVIDISNPLDFSKGFPPSLFTGNTDSLGEEAQRTLPDSKVVKALNHVTASLMVDPKRLDAGDHDALISGNDRSPKFSKSGSAGKASSISAISLRPAVPRAIWRCGCGFTARSVLQISTSKS
jgi:predicted dinucleotide-binding enzyme